jgi:hypothetical protein
MTEWVERLTVIRYATVQRERLAWVSRFREEAAYDGLSKPLETSWARELVAGQFVLHPTLADLLASFEPATLARAIRKRPEGFARALAEEHDLGRVMVGHPFYDGLLPPDFEVRAPAVLGEELVFQTLVPANLDNPQRPWRLWSIRAALGLLTPRRKSLRAFRPPRRPPGSPDAT